MTEGGIIIPIRYDGLYAEQHKIELYTLGESLQGMARILAVVGHFAATGEYAKQMQALDAKVYLQETHANCVTVDAALQFIKDYGLAEGALVVIVPSLVAWLFDRRAEMKALKETAQKALDVLADNQKQKDLTHQQTVDRLVGVMERMAEALRPSLRAAVAPIGRSCKTMTIGSAPPIDEAMAAAIRSEVPTDVSEAREWFVLISEMDLETATAKIRFADDEEIGEVRFKAEIKDPAFKLPGNAYRVAFSKELPIRVTGKATLRDGEIQTLFITDAKPPDTH